MKKGIVIVLFLAIIGIGVYWLWLKSDGTILPNFSGTKEQDLGALPKVDRPAVKVDDPTTYPPEKFISLANGTDSTVIGDAYRTYLQNNFVFKIAATLPEPKNLTDYKVWLVRPSDQEYVGLGTLERRDSSQGVRWTVSFTSDKELEQFSNVVVTVGTNVTNPNKADVILRGSF